MDDKFNMHKFLKCYMLFHHNLVIILYINPTLCTIFLSMSISFLYMFQTTMCPSSGDITVSMRQLVFVTPCGWLSGMHGGTSTKCHIYTVVSPDDGHIVA